MNLTFQQELILVIVENLLIAVFLLAIGYFLNRQIEKYRGQQDMLVEKYRGQQDMAGELERLRNETAVRHLEEQIREFYAPLLGLTEYTKALSDIQMKRLSLAQSEAEYGQILYFFRTQYFIPCNKQIADILKSKLYLVEGVEIPQAFSGFIVHQAQLEALLKLGEAQGIGTLGMIGQSYPPEFDGYIRQTLSALQSRYDGYRKRLTSDILPE